MVIVSIECSVAEVVSNLGQYMDFAVGMGIQGAVQDQSTARPVFRDACAVFSVMKCADISCLVCKAPRLPEDVFQSLHHVPDPVPNGDHYKDFAALYGTETSEQHKPSSKDNSGTKSHGMQFAPNAQYAKNVGTVIQCSE